MRFGSGFGFGFGLGLGLASMGSIAPPGQGTHAARPRCGPCDSQREARLRRRWWRGRWRLASTTGTGRTGGRPPKLSIGRKSTRAPRATRESCQQRRRRRRRCRRCSAVHWRARLGLGAAAVARRARRSTQRLRSSYGKRALRVLARVRYPVASGGGSTSTRAVRCLSHANGRCWRGCGTDKPKLSTRFHPASSRAWPSLSSSLTSYRRPPRTGPRGPGSCSPAPRSVAS